MAHDFNNLLTPIIGSLDMLQRRGLGGEREQRLVEAGLKSAERAKVLVHRLLAFARRQSLQPEPIDIAGLVTGMEDLLTTTLGPRVGIDLRIQPGLPPAVAEAHQLEMALLNLAVNARDAMPDGGTLTVSCAEAGIDAPAPPSLDPGGYVRIAVSDNGVGMDADTLARAIDPFFSTKGVGKGTGLGLSMVHGLVSQLGGGLEISSQLGTGTRVEMWLPMAKEAPENVAKVTGVVRSEAAAGVVLLVDDEADVRESTAAMLGEFGYHVIEANSAEEALEWLDRATVDVVVTDHLMPGMTGAELAGEIAVLNPAARVLIVSGYAEGDDIPPSLPRLTKPFRSGDLRAALATLND